MGPMTDLNDVDEVIHPVVDIFVLRKGVEEIAVPNMPLMHSIIRRIYCI